MTNMTKRIVALATVVVVGMVAMSAPFRFDDSSEDVKDFVVIGITNCIHSSTVALMHRRSDEVLRPEDALMPHYYNFELGFEVRRCLVVLKGEMALSGNKTCYLYETPRRANLLPNLWISCHGPSSECYFEGGEPPHGKVVWLTGRKRWIYHPPYDPFSSSDDEFVQLMFLTPEHTLDKKRIKPNKYHHGLGTIMDFIDKGYMNNTPEELMAKLKVEKAFSNRVFRMNEGCAFQVDYPMPDMDWRGWGNKKEHLEMLKRIQTGCSELMHLSADEVSEIVYLSYLVDGGDVKGYEAACARCPKMLKPVAELKTGIGKRLRKAMLEGGMLRMANGK